MRGKLEINIRKNAMAVTATILPGGDTEITEELLRNELETRGITGGISDIAIREMAEYGVYKRPYMVANGLFATRGAEGWYEFFFDKDVKENVPTINEDGNVDYSPAFQLIDEGQLLARYHHAGEGSDGYTIFGAEIVPAPAKELPPLNCKNVEKIGDDYYAAIKGKVTFDKNRLEVTMDIKGNVGYDMKSLNFKGDMHVFGDVLTDVSINIDGDLQVDGVIEGAVINVGGDIVVRHGIHGMGKAVITAGGSITTNFIEDAKVTATGSIVINHAINAEIISKNGVVAQGKSGQILGGAVEAQRCDVFTLGNENGKRTNIVLKADAPKKADNVALIVRKRICDGAHIEINNVKMNRKYGTNGEFHCTEDGIERCEIGKFRYKTPEAPKKPETVVQEKPLIMIVDDDPVVLKNEYKCLVEKYRVVAVNSAPSALAFFEKGVPDLILLDYMMPQMNGGELLQLLRGLPDKTIASIPVFFLTSVTDRKLVMECMKLFPQGYLLKPLSKEELQKIVGDFFEKNAR